MKKAHDQVSDFHRLVGAHVGDVKEPDATVDLELRVRLIAEEFDELLAALDPHGPRPPVAAVIEQWIGVRGVHSIMRTHPGSAAPDIPRVADALADLEYVTIGSAVTWGIAGDAVWEEVHSANMRKGGGPKDPVTGKALKPEGWTPPDVEGVLRRESEKASRRRTHQRGDQVASVGGFFGRDRSGPGDRYRWLLDEQVAGIVWWAYELELGCVPGRRCKIDVSIAPMILEPWPIERMPWDDAYDEMRNRVVDAIACGDLPSDPTDEQRADWADGQRKAR